ncbi:hypothetical protein HORIV_10370 [Vreelandella olivaria]|uniref:Uncharacterized protein n=1 Tax=Vreelandella olivaria TaxID=390919 RepID=A0ABM7GE40_9GAMM|nr:hypothetical protein HORIV_10370 [Halomonas olivaria]
MLASVYLNGKTLNDGGIKVKDEREVGGFDTSPRDLTNGGDVGGNQEGFACAKVISAVSHDDSFAALKHHGHQWLVYIEVQWGRLGLTNNRQTRDGYLSNAG